MPRIEDRLLSITTSENKDDAFDLKVSDRPELARLEVIGGSGRWSGAAGKGKFTRVSSEGDQNSFSFEVEITTP